MGNPGSSVIHPNSRFSHGVCVCVFACVCVCERERERERESLDMSARSPTGGFLCRIRCESNTAKKLPLKRSRPKSAHAALSRRPFPAVAVPRAIYKSIGCLNCLWSAAVKKLERGRMRRFRPHRASRDLEYRSCGQQQQKKLKKLKKLKKIRV